MTKEELEKLVKTQDRKLRQNSKECNKAIYRVEVLNKKNAELEETITKAKEIIKDLLFFLNKFYNEDCPVCMDEAEQFLKETN